MFGGGENRGKRGDFGGCGWKCLGGGSVRRWHGGDERGCYGTCGGRDETTNFEVKLQPHEVCSTRPNLETLKRLSSKRLFWSRRRYRRYGGESEV